jgi:hypothetical protein
MVRSHVLAGALAATVLSTVLSLGAIFFLIKSMQTKSPRLTQVSSGLEVIATPAAGNGTGGRTVSGIGSTRGLASGTHISIGERVKAAAQPAKVEFAVPLKMTMGLRYQARLELLREGITTKFLSKNIVISEELKILDKVRASVDSTDLKIDRISPDDWQEVIPGGRGLWVWSVEPLRPGDAHLIVNIHHAAIVDGVERRFLVDSFPRTVTIEVDWWGRVLYIATGAPAFFSSTVGLIGSFSTLAGLGAGCLVWARRRKGHGSEQAEFPIDTSDSKRIRTRRGRLPNLLPPRLRPWRRGHRLEA